MTQAKIDVGKIDGVVLSVEMTDDRWITVITDTDIYLIQPGCYRVKEVLKDELENVPF